MECDLIRVLEAARTIVLMQSEGVDKEIIGEEFLRRLEGRQLIRLSFNMRFESYSNFDNCY